MREQKNTQPKASGRLRIGDHWNAITILALSQNNPLKAVAVIHCKNGRIQQLRQLRSRS